MGKLSKQVVKRQKEIYDLIQNSDKLTPDEIELIYEEFNEAYLQDITSGSAFFTPLDMALDFALMAPIHGYVLDACAGIGVLSYAAKVRDSLEHNIKQLICIELNPAYVKIGKKLLPQADWYCGSIFDRELHNEIMNKYGIERYDSMISNPPFGTTTMKFVPDDQREWLDYTGKEFEMAVIEVGHKLSKNNSYILPQQVCSFAASTENQHNYRESRKFNKLKKDLNEPNMLMNWLSIDTRVYDGFKNTTITVECCLVEIDDWQPEN